MSVPQASASPQEQRQGVPHVVVDLVELLGWHSRSESSSPSPQQQIQTRDQHSHVVHPVAPRVRYCRVLVPGVIREGNPAELLSAAEVPAVRP